MELQFRKYDNSWRLLPVKVAKSCPQCRGCRHWGFCLQAEVISSVHYLWSSLLAYEASIAGFFGGHVSRSLRAPAALAEVYLLRLVRAFSPHQPQLLLCKVAHVPLCTIRKLCLCCAYCRAWEEIFTKFKALARAQCKLSKEKKGTNIVASCSIEITTPPSTICRRPNKLHAVGRHSHVIPEAPGCSRGESSLYSDIPRLLKVSTRIALKGHQRMCLCDGRQVYHARRNDVSQVLIVLKP